MQGSPAVIEILNELLTAELTVINQYFIHAKMCENWGYRRLGDYIRHESIDEMKHADIVIDRILFLEGKLRGEEEHLDWIETQLELIEQVGLQNYLSQQIHG